MHQDRDFELQEALMPHEHALIQDLALDTLFQSMAQGDRFLWDVAKNAILTSLRDPESIFYRQNILKDCLTNTAVVKDIYYIAVESIEKRKKHFWSYTSKYPGSILYGALEILQLFTEQLKKLKRIAQEHAHQFTSEGFRAFFSMIEKELGNDFFSSTQNHLRALKFRDGILIRAELGKGNESTLYSLCKPREINQSWFSRIFSKKPPAYVFRIDERDENGCKILSNIKDRGINSIANTLAQSADHLEDFFQMLRIELAFYIGCLNLHDCLTQIHAPTSFPLPVRSYKRKFSCMGLYDICLALNRNQKISGNDVCADDKDLTIITGANQGGKSTFLRSVGIAQLMMQCGLFVPAERFQSNICNGLFTHYRREEDTSLKSGKLDEELGRLSAIVEHLKPNAMILFNESFAATNEREGSEIARQIICALIEKRIKILFVTHQYEFAHSFYEKKLNNVLFLRAPRQADGKRTFQLIEGEPLQTSYGHDLYDRVFGKHDAIQTPTNLFVKLYEDLQTISKTGSPNIQSGQHESTEKHVQPSR
jgi:DNA mismatch repair ATPase MutS